jgi:hypothetical protein
MGSAEEAGRKAVVERRQVRSPEVEIAERALGEIAAEGRERHVVAAEAE